MRVAACAGAPAALAQSMDAPRPAVFPSFPLSLEHRIHLQVAEGKLRPLVAQRARQVCRGQAGQDGGPDSRGQRWLHPSLRHAVRCSSRHLLCLPRLLPTCSGGLEGHGSQLQRPQLGPAAAEATGPSAHQHQTAAHVRLRRPLSLPSPRSRLHRPYRSITHLLSSSIISDGSLKPNSPRRLM